MFPLPPACIEDPASIRSFTVIAQTECSEPQWTYSPDHGSLRSMTVQLTGLYWLTWRREQKCWLLTELQWSNWTAATNHSGSLTDLTLSDMSLKGVVGLSLRVPCSALKSPSRAVLNRQRQLALCYAFRGNDIEPSIFGQYSEWPCSTFASLSDHIIRSAHYLLVCVGCPGDYFKMMAF